MVDTAAQFAVVVEQPPAALEFYNGVVSRPAQHRLENAPAVCEGSVGGRTRGIAQVVAVTGGVAEVVGVAALVHPRGLEEAPVVVVGGNGLPCFGRKDYNLAHLFGKLVHVVCQTGDARSQSLGARPGGLLGTEPGVVIGRRVALLVALQLAAPETAEVEVGLAVGIDERRRVDAVAALDGRWVSRERSFGTVADGNADAEDVVVVACGKVEVVFPVAALGGIRGPELLRHPGDILGAENNAVVHYGGCGVERVRAEDMVVGHVILVAIVIELDVCLAVVRRIDVDAPLEDVG